MFFSFDRLEAVFLVRLETSSFPARHESRSTTAVAICSSPCTNNMGKHPNWEPAHPSLTENTASGITTFDAFRHKTYLWNKDTFKTLFYFVQVLWNQKVIAVTTFVELSFISIGQEEIRSSNLSWYKYSTHISIGRFIKLSNIFLFTNRVSLLDWCDQLYCFAVSE